MKPEFDIPVELHRLLQGMIQLSDGVRLIACTKGTAGASIAKRWPTSTYFEPGEFAALDASTRDLFGFLSRGEMAAIYMPPNEARPITVDFMTWNFHGYDAVRWETSGIKTDGAPIEKIKLMADDVLRLLERPVVPTMPEAQPPNVAGAKKSSLSLGRPSYRKDDQLLIEEMYKLISSGKAASAHEAARIVAPKARGLSENSIIDRLRHRYSDWIKTLENNGV